MTRSSEHLLGSATGRKPSVAVVFGGAENFRVDMGVELFEHHPAFLDAVAVHDRVMPVPLGELLWYRPARSAEPDHTQRLAAMVAVGVGTDKVFSAQYAVDVPVRAGTGVGYLSAGIAAGALELHEVLSWIRTDALTESQLVARAAEHLKSQQPERPPVRFDSFKQLVDLLGREDALDAVVDLGPGNTAAAALRGAGAVSMPVGAIDSPINRLHVRDQLRRSKFYNPAYVVERTLGQLVSTRNLLPDGDGYRTVNDLARRLKDLLRREELPRTLPTDGAELVISVIREAVSCWITNGLVKGYSREQIVDSLMSLEHETLFPLLATFDLSVQSLETFDLREMPRAL